MSEYERAVKPEVTGWRDLGLSERHRRWGFNCPAVDLDFVLCEFDRGVPFAIVEYKSSAAPPVAVSHPSIRALEALATRARIPFFIVVYNRDYSVFIVTPGNYYAERFYKGRMSMNESQYIAFMYRVRGRNYSGALF